MKKGFTLLEMLVSITLFSVVLVFLYEVLETTKNHNIKYEQQIDKKLNKFDIEFVIFTDMVNRKNKKLTLTEDRDGNSVVRFLTNNTYHNPFYNEVTYFLSKDNKLLRIESNKKLNLENVSDALENSFVDIMDKKVTKFKVIPSDDKQTYLFYIEYENEEYLSFPIKNNL